MKTNESTVTPTVIGVDGHVVIRLGDDNYLRMSDTAADNFGREILKAAMQSRGETGHLFIIPVQ